MINSHFAPRTLVQLRERILEFKKLENEKNNDILKSRFFELFGIFPMTVFFNKTESLKHIPLYRACPVDKVIERDKSRIESYMGPPKELEVGKGRANLNGKNVFYAGDSPYVTIVENKRVQIGQEYFVGQWEIDVDKINDEEIPISYITYNNLTDSNPWNGIIPTIQNLKKDIINKFKIEQEEADLIVEFTQEIANLFSSVGANYNLSAFIADSILYSENVQKFVPNILVFPSVESQKNSCNIAINTDFAEKYLVLKKVVKMKITEVFADNFKADISTIGQVEMGRVQFYHFNFDASRAEYTIDTVKCGCGMSFRLKDPENFILWIRGKQVSFVNRQHKVDRS